jgi:hypothetical protein
MARKIFGPRKQRTREHVIADQSVNHVERFVIDKGYTVQQLDSDYGYDLVLFTYDDKGYIEPGSMFIQLKAAEALQAVGANYVFDLDIRDYNLWMLEDMPVILILFDAFRRRAHWVAVQDYFTQNVARRPKRGAKTVRIRVSKRQVVNQRAVAEWRRLKWEARDQTMGEES